MKVIHMMGSSLTSSLSSYMSGIDVRFFENDWHNVVAKQIGNYTQKFKLECWRPERTLKESYVREKEGITHRLFPSCSIPVPGTKPFEVSLTLLTELRKERKGEELLLHLYQVFNPNFYLILLLSKDIPVVAHDFGEWWGGRVWWLSHLVGFIPQKIAFRNVDYFFAPSEEQARLLSRIVPRDKIEIQTMGIDFNRFKPLDKKEARKRLNLPVDKKIILNVGELTGLRKRADVNIKAYQALKNDYDVELVCVGNSPLDPLYSQAKSAGARVMGLVADEEMPLYYNAADVYATFPNPLWLTKTGLIAVAEALACNTPVVVSAPYDPILPEEWSKIGEIPPSEEDAARGIAKIFNHPEAYVNCREIARKYYDVENINQNIIRVYDNLFAKYYG